MQTNWQPAKSPSAGAAYAVVTGLQKHLVEALKTAQSAAKLTGEFVPVSWTRDAGRHGGGTRLAHVPADESSKMYNRASVNVSQVQYDDDPTRSLASATAISSIVHPMHPRLPSIHLHVSWTEMKNGKGYWRIMGDLNPSHSDDVDRRDFIEGFRKCSGSWFKEGCEQGDAYFNIPVLNRHRGVAHFYLEQFSTGDFAADREFAETFGRTMIDTYRAILLRAIPSLTPPTKAERETQLHYHTVYLFQVLTLDRGTTSGLMVHDQNDVGILGSLPSHIDRAELKSWVPRMPKPQDELLAAMVEVIPNSGFISDSIKIELCRVIREHYRKWPAALDMQARGSVLPPTVQNHLVGS